VRLSAEDGNDFRGLNRVEGQFTVDTRSRFGVQTRWDHFEETDGGHYDETLLGDTELTYRFVQRDWVEMTTGIGFRMMTDKHVTRGGFNFYYGSDLYLMKPLVVSSSVDLGNLDAGFVVHTRCTLGAVWRHWEFLGGYDFLRVGSVNLQGPMLGVRLWY
jgi:hypothetical protein